MVSNGCFQRSKRARTVFLTLIIIKGLLVFEGDATFTSNEERTDDSTNAGRGGAISNAAPGTILFEGSLTMTENDADVSSLSIQFADLYPTFA